MAFALPRYPDVISVRSAERAAQKRGKAMEYTVNPLHGGDWEGYMEKYGCLPLDFSANISPLGMPEAAAKALAESVTEAQRYPDPFCRELRKGLSRTEQVPANWILCGNGAADLIFRIAYGLHPGNVLLAVPGFAEYRSAMEQAGCRIFRFRLRRENQFRLDEAFIEKITSDIDMVFLCEPNNPTGITTEPDLLKQILDRCRKKNVLLVADECFNDFLDEPERHSLKRYLKDYPNLLILKAFTKIYAMAGLRVGYLLCSNEEIMKKTAACGQPWPVSGPGQKAACAALSDTGYVKKVRMVIHRERERMFSALQVMGFPVIPGEANFLLFRGPEDLDRKLEKQGILIRDCSNFEGLDRGWFRIAIRTPEENGRMLEGLRFCTRGRCRSTVLDDTT